MDPPIPFHQVSETPGLPSSHHSPTMPLHQDRPDLLEHHSLSPTPSLQHLRNVCLKAYFAVLAQILSLALFHRFSATDVLTFIQYGVVTYGFSDAMSSSLYDSGTLLSRFYHCAAHGLDLTSSSAHFVPIHLPIAAYPENPFLRRRFPTVRAAIHAAETFCKWVDYHVLWLAECILRSSAKGLTSEWNFGLALGMRKIDFIREIAPLDPARQPHDYLTGLGGRLFLYHDLDLQVAQLIRPWFTRAGALQGPTQIAAALYPIEHSLAGPMDVVMSTGFNRMEDDSDEILERHKERGI
ncbi:hypothetical protein C8R44DRAFT_818393 [Mycena epipterygia]|nr:hypothetical protein C8R44DRAFT_818393 [Mycena epipterygia]